MLGLQMALQVPSNAVKIFFSWTMSEHSFCSVVSLAAAGSGTWLKQQTALASVSISNTSPLSTSGELQGHTGSETKGELCYKTSFYVQPLKFHKMNL